jgi:hypothetical protein
MAEKPILFSTKMVKAILDGGKTQTRRVIKGTNSENFEFISLTTDPEITAIDKNGNEYPRKENGLWAEFIDKGDYAPVDFPMFKSRYQVGDILWVRETWCKLYDLDGTDKIIAGTDNYYYAVDNPTFPYNRFLRDNGTYKDYPAWRSSMFMPRAAARIFLRLTDVRAERLQDISEADAHAEGMDSPGYPIIQFKDLWSELNDHRNDGAYSWDNNPWVWVISFERVKK